jgi:diguanylate cyclase (GGDEF)-like protein/PAS domain S-box-containing protein
MDASRPPTGDEWSSFLGRVNRSYETADRARYLLERSVEISSGEMSDLYEKLRGLSESTIAERDRLMTVISSVGDGICVVDGSGRIEIVNDEAKRLLGVDDPVGRELSTVMALGNSGGDVLTRRALGTGYFAFGLPERSDDCLLLRADGSRMFIAYTLSPLSFAGVRQGAVIVLRDTSGRVAMDTLAAARQHITETVARGMDANGVYGSIAAETARITGADRAALLQCDRVSAATILGSWSADGGEWLPRGTPLPLADCPVLQSLANRDRPAASSLEQETSATALVGVPILVGSALWGALLVRSPTLADAAQTLERLADTVTLAVTSAEARQGLLELASNDPLTGISNHRTFQAELRACAAPARKAPGTLALALFDLDHFKSVNDTFGHPVGDAVLKEFAARLRMSSRRDDVVARVGGEEFAWIFTAPDEISVWTLADQVRKNIVAKPFAHVGTLTVSVGVATLDQAGTVEELVHLADGALYAAKQQGRDASVLFDRDAVKVFSATEHAEHLQRRQALQSIRVLARAVDAKDPLTQQHSERVARLVVGLAEALDWSDDRRTALEEAGLVHDVGKIGVSDAILFKTGPLTGDERLQIQGHSLLGAQILDGVLSEEQVAWVRGHHERYDGKGYPDGLEGRKIPDGARLLAVADAWDAMTSGRPYQGVRSRQEALDECRAGSGTQFCPEAVGALERLLATDHDVAIASRSAV